MGKRKPLEAVFPCKDGKCCERYARVRCDLPLARQVETRKLRGRVDDHGIQSLVRNEQVRAVADEQRLHAGVLQKAHQHNKLLPRFRKGHAPGRAADAERRVFCHRLIFDPFEVGQIVMNSIVQCGFPRHSGSPVYGF